jgi:hypothetical protein
LSSQAVAAAVLFTLVAVERVGSAPGQGYP